MRRAGNAVSSRKGFSLVELAVVVIIIGVLAAFGVPRFRDAVERSKASEAFSFLASVRSAQERYQARQGRYATTLGALDINVTAPKFFMAGGTTPAAITSTTAFDVGVTPGTPSWKLILVRNVASSSYGAYTVIFSDDGFDTVNSTIASDTDLNARINPIGD